MQAPGNRSSQPWRHHQHFPRQASRDTGCMQQRPSHLQDSPAPCPAPSGQQPARLHVMLVVGRMLLLLLQVSRGTAVAVHVVLRRWVLSPWRLLQHQSGGRWRRALPAFCCLQDRCLLLSLPDSASKACL